MQVLLFCSAFSIHLALIYTDSNLPQVTSYCAYSESISVKIDMEFPHWNETSGSSIKFCHIRPYCVFVNDFVNYELAFICTCCEYAYVSAFHGMHSVFFSHFMLIGWKILHWVNRLKWIFLSFEVQVYRLMFWWYEWAVHYLWNKAVKHQNIRISFLWSVSIWHTWFVIYK